MQQHDMSITCSFMRGGEARELAKPRHVGQYAKVLSQDFLAIVSWFAFETFDNMMTS